MNILKYAQSSNNICEIKRKKKSFSNEDKSRKKSQSKGKNTSSGFRKNNVINSNIQKNIANNIKKINGRKMYYNNFKPMTMMQIDPKNPNQPIYYMMVPYIPESNTIDKDKVNNFNNMNYSYYPYMMQNFQNMNNDAQEYPYAQNPYSFPMMNPMNMGMMDNKK